MSVLHNLANIFRTIRLSDLVDMAIMAFLIYKVLYFLARTGSGRVLRGLVLLVLVMLVANQMHLNVVNFVFGKTFELGILALLIVFQPEVRSMLEKVGGITKLITKRDQAQDLEKAIEQVVQTCRDLAPVKTGALMVFERDNVLDEPIRTGTLVDAETQAELLKTIFYKGSPLHDGAVIIRNGRIAAASCMLPVTNSTHLSRELGSRHRAGIGISEKSDAVVVIISEETGSVSVAVDGSLSRHLTDVTLEKRLRNELLKNTEERSMILPLPDFIKDWKHGKNKEDTGK